MGRRLASSKNKGLFSKQLLERRTGGRGWRGREGNLEHVWAAVIAMIFIHGCKARETEASMAPVLSLWKNESSCHWQVPFQPEAINFLFSKISPHPQAQGVPQIRRWFWGLKQNVSKGALCLPWAGLCDFQLGCTNLPSENPQQPQEEMARLALVCSLGQ